MKAAGLKEGLKYWEQEQRVTKYVDFISFWSFFFFPKSKATASKLFVETPTCEKLRWMMGGNILWRKSIQESDQEGKPEVGGCPCKCEMEMI